VTNAIVKITDAFSSGMYTSLKCS